MRVIGGEAKGRKIQAPRDRTMRLTSDRVKEALFNLLPDMDSLVFLELFAGTGNVSIEALSRGANRAILVEKDPKRVDLIRRNLAACGFEGRSEIINRPVEKALPILADRGDLTHIVFADPPYEKGHAGEILALLGQGRLFEEEGLAVVEHSFREKTGSRYGALVLRDQRRYGDTVLSFFGVDKNSER